MISSHFRRIAPVGLVIVATASAGVWVAVAARERVAEAAALKVVHDTAVMEHRDPDAAVRKARHVTDALSEDFRTDRGETAEDVARFLVMHARRLCGGGLR
jgi:hypothetical protein